MPAREGGNNNNNTAPKDPQKEELEALALAIHESWLRDCAKVEEMQRTDAILKEILALDSIEAYFEKQETFQYFMVGFSDQVIVRLLAQSTIYGEGGEEAAFEILKDYCDLFIKFHANPAYTKLWEKFKEIFEPGKQFYCYSQLTRINNSLKATSASEFNSLFLKRKYDNRDLELVPETEIDLLVQSKEIYNYWIWVRGIICNVFEEHITVRSPESETPHVIKKDSYEYVKVGTYTTDWEWRSNLKEGDIIDCLERGTYFPATIAAVHKSEHRGINKTEYKVTFKIYEDSVEDLSKYLLFWNETNIQTDSHGRKYIGNVDNFDENIAMYSKRLYKRDTKIWAQKGKKISSLTDSGYTIDELFDKEDKEGNKTITIGRTGTYSYFFNLLINYIGQQGFFETAINNLSKFNSKDSPISNEVLMTGFYILNKCAEYLYLPFAIEVANLLKQKVFSYIENLSEADLRNLKKETIELISETLKKYVGILNKVDENESEILDKFQIAFSMKLLKTNFLEKRNSAMKGIIDLIRGAHFDKDKQKEILKLIKDNKIIFEIFGPNSHVQLISKSKELIQILLEFDELDQDELNLIWSCTKNGDLEAKLTILKIFREIYYSLKPNHIKMLLESMTTGPEGTNEGKEMLEDELNLTFDLLGKLVEFDDNSPIISKCIDNFTNHLIKLDFTEKAKIDKLLQRFMELSRQHPKIKTIILKKAINLIETNTNFIIGLKLIHSFKDNIHYQTDNEFTELLLKDNFLVNLYKKCFDDYIKKAAEEFKDYQNKEPTDDEEFTKKEAEHMRCIHTLLEFLLGLISNRLWPEEDDKIQLEDDEANPQTQKEEESPIDFVYEHLFLKNINSRDKVLFYTWSKTLLKNDSCHKKIYKLFTEKIFVSQKNIEELIYEGFDLYWNLFAAINKDNLIVSGDSIYCNVPAQELIGFDLLWKIIFQSKNKNIMMKGIHLLSDLFKTFDNQGTESSEGLQKLIELCINELKQNNINGISKSIAMLHRIIEESEKFGTADIVSHMSLQSRNKHLVNVNTLAFRHASDFSLELPSNTTIYQLKKCISEKLKYHFDFLKFELKNFNYHAEEEKGEDSEDSFTFQNDNENIVLEYNLNGRTFYSLGFPHEIFITVSPNGIEKTIPTREILVDREPIPEVLVIFGEWFDKYSENGKMTPALCGKFVKEVTNSDAEVSATDNRVVELFRERDRNNDGLLEREEFVEFYSDSTRAKPSLVYENIKAMGSRNDLKKMSENYYPVNTDKTALPRYQLAVNDDFFDSIFNSFSPVKEDYEKLSDVEKKENERLERINMDIFQLINQLVTNPKIYDKILNNQGENWGEVFNEDNIYKMIYCLEIIESLIANVSNEEGEKIEVCKQWVKLYLEKNGYDYLIKIFLKFLAEIEKKKNKIEMIAVNTLIRNIKILYINAHEAYTQEKLHQFLVKENLCEKVNNSIKSFDIVSNILKIINSFINTKEYEITNELFELLSLIMPTVNLSESFDYDLFLKIIKEGVLNENVFIRDKFSNVIIRMVYLLEEQKKYDLIEKIMNYILDCIKNLEESKGQISSNLFEIFTLLLDDYLKHKEDFSSAKFLDPEFSKKITSIIKDGLDKKLRLNDEIFIGYIKLISKMASVQPEFKEYLSNGTTLINDIITKVLFKNNTKSQDNSTTPFVELEDEITKNKKSSKSKMQKRKICYEFVISLLENSVSNIEQFFNMDIFSNKDEEEEKEEVTVTTTKYGAAYYYHKVSDEKKKEGYVGLKNLGCICYMNSSLQQFFMVPSLRFGLLRFDDGEEENPCPTHNGLDDNLFHQTQKLFSYLQLSERMDYNPFGFTFAFKDFEGQPTRISEQKDAQEFLSIFFDRMENSCKKTKYKYLIQNIFGGKNCSQIKCSECHKTNNRFEDLLFLSLQVKNMKNLNESLLNQIAEEKIDGYECDGCKKKVTISKRNILSSLPNVLIVHLQRILYNFEYDHNEKINSYLEFPKKINLKPYTLEEASRKSGEQENDDIYFRSDAYYNYYLVGVVIHVGSADSGHYYSYINTIREGKGDIADYDETDPKMDSCWLEYNDSNISKFNLEKLEEECFGGTSQVKGGYGFWGATENCKNAYLLVYERKIKMPQKMVIKQEEAEEKIKKGMNLIDIKDANEMKKTTKKFDLLRYYGTPEYEKMTKEIYSSVFHDEEKQEFYIYKPFYFQKKKVPRKYYNEIIKDNLSVEKKQNISDKDFIGFIGQLINILEKTLINNSDKIDEESLKKIANTYLNFLFTILTKKDKMEFLSKALENLSKITAQLPKFAELTLEYFLSNQNAFNLIINENAEMVKQTSNLIYNLILSIYNNNQEQFKKELAAYGTENRIEVEENCISKSISSLVKIMEKFPAEIQTGCLGTIESLLETFKKLYLLSEDFMFFFKKLDFIPKMVTLILGKESPYYIHTVSATTGNWDCGYGVRSEVQGASHIIDIIYDMCQHSKIFSKEATLEFSEDDTSCIYSPAFLKFVFGNNQEYFLNFLIILSKDNLDFTIVSSGELLKNLDNLSIYNSKQELLSILTCCLKLLEIEDSYQQMRYELLFGMPQNEVKNSRRGGVLPLLGYHSISHIRQNLFKFKSPIFQSEKIDTIVTKIFENTNQTQVAAEIFINLLKACLNNHSLFKYISILPYESLEYKSFIDYGTHLVADLGDEDNALKNELTSMTDSLNNLFKEIVKKEELTKRMPGFVSRYMLSTVKYGKVYKIFEEGSIMIFLIDYYCDYLPYDEDNIEIDFSNSQSNYSIYNYNRDDRGEIKEEENFNAEELEKENIHLIDSDDYGQYGEEKCMKLMKKFFTENTPNAVIIENKYSVPSVKNCFRRIFAVNSEMDENCIQLKFKRKTEVAEPNEYLPVSPMIFKISYQEAKEIFNVCKLNVEKEWTFDANDISIEIANSFYGLEFPSKVRFYN